MLGWTESEFDQPIVLHQFFRKWGVNPVKKKDFHSFTPIFENLSGTGLEVSDPTIVLQQLRIVRHLNKKKKPLD